MFAWIRFYHLKHTTGRHRKQRKAHAYADVCFQCGAPLAPRTRVAAHVVEQPLCPLLCGVGRVSLRTTCKRCNRREQPFWKCCLPLAELLEWKCC